MKQKIGIIGCGNMGSALVDALLSAKVTTPRQVFAFDKEISKVRRLRKRWSIRCAGSATELVRSSTIIILAVKPQNIVDLLQSINREKLRRKLIISILAGTTCATLSRLIGQPVRIIRSMPNLGIMVGSGVTALCRNKWSTQRDMRVARSIFASCGLTVTIPEKYFDIVTAISGSGPAYYFYFTELLMQEARKRGIKQSDATCLAVATADGAARLMKSTPMAPQVLRGKVTSPGGTTAAAMRIFLSAGFRRQFSHAIGRAIRRAKYLRR